MLSTFGLCLSVLVVRSKVRKSGSQYEKQGNCRGKGRGSHREEETQEQLEKMAKSPGGPSQGRTSARIGG